ncbi:MAG TPA: hypothetical protein DIT07_11010 [Sphingobacteriaceae bacterium]|nr:hypothetical protein [Sphingobacteriaceae bacterium]
MNKNRLENFSDGVFAIAVTLLILNVKTPETKDLKNVQLNQVLYNAIPHMLTFIFSFLVIGVFWVAHHRIFSFVKVLDSHILWLNIVYLLFVAITPLSSAILSEYPFLPTAILFYTSTLLVIAIMHLVLLEYILRNKYLKHEALTRDVYKAAQRTAVVGPLCYTIAAAASWINAYISFFFIIGAMVFYIFFSGKGIVEEKMITTARKEAQ